MNNQNKTEQEFKTAQEYTPAADNKTAIETKQYGDPPQTAEIGETEKRAGVAKNKKQKSNISKVLQSLVVGGFALVAVGSGTLFPSNEKIKANIGEIKAFDTYAEYVIDVAPSDGLELSLIIFNDYYKSETSVSAGETTGKAEGLTPGKNYTIAVKDKSGMGESTVIKKTFRTLLPEQVPRTQFNGIQTACRCGVDGRFYFKLSYTDQNNYWSDYSAVLENLDSNTIVGTCDFSANKTDEQWINVSNLAKGNYRLTVKVLSVDPKDTQTAPKTKVLYSGIVEI